VNASTQLRFIDLFSGIGGFHLALEEALGAECVFASDIDETCRDVYKVNFGIEPSGDIRPLTEGASVEVPDHDILCAGFPCQPFSKSGHQRGINETRGTLFFNILKILEARRPKFVLLENVRNLAGPRHRHTWATIIENLRMLGYRVSNHPTILSPHLLPPRLGGRPQVRERVFIPAVYVGDGVPIQDLVSDPLALNHPVQGWDPQLWHVDDYLQDESEIEHLERFALRDSEVLWLETWNELLQALPSSRLPGFPIWADDFRPSPEIPLDTPAWKRDFLEKNSAFYVAHREVIDAWLTKHGRLQDLPPSRRKLEWQAQDSRRDLWELVMHLRPSGIRVKRGTYLPALVAITQTSVIGWRRRRITPREAARLQGFPDTFLLHPEDAVAYRHLGNAVNVGVVAYLASALVASESSAAEPALFDEQVVIAS
jgi:DNA (cytosine-5)-methyltransferase 1